MNKRYELRPWSLSDCRSLAEYANNIHVWNNLRDSFPSPYTEEDARVYIANTLTKDCVQDFAIIVDGKAVGGIGFIPQVDVERYSAEIGYWLGEPYWGCGIMSKVVSEVVEYVFATTELVRLYASVFKSIRLPEKFWKNVVFGWWELCIKRFGKMTDGWICVVTRFLSLRRSEPGRTIPGTE